MEKIIMMTTPDCTQCKMVKPMIEARGLDIEVVDATVEPDRAAKFDVMGVPYIGVEKEDSGEVLAFGGAACTAYVNQQ